VLAYSPSFENLLGIRYQQAPLIIIIIIIIRLISVRYSNITVLA